MLIFVCVISALLSSFGASAGLYDNHISDVACLETETLCAGGCCPYANATCCSETQTCCRQGAVCLGRLDTCLGLQSGDKNKNTPALYSERTAELRKVAGCPSGTTACYGGCCPLPNAVCCPDKVTCCPSGYVCDVGRCKKNVKASATFLNAVLTKSSLITSSYSVEQPVLKKFPVSLTGGQCCMTISGYKCCPDFWICTFGGCVPNGEI